MGLSIVWRATSDTDQKSQLKVPVFGAELVLTRLGDVIVDASWQLAEDGAAQDLPPQAISVRDYLLWPLQKTLQVELLIQGTVFQQKVWQALLQIPLGQMLSYSALAEQLASGPRAIAGACVANPYAGLIPCHRVVGKAGIGGFMGCASGAMVDLKRRILEAERRTAGA